jgi:hypothetical protein
MHAHAVEVVSAQQKIKDGRTVRQLLIDTYAENEKKEDKEGHAGNNGKHSMEINEIEKESVKDMKHGKKFPTPFYQQTYVLAKRTFIQRRGDLLGWDRIFLILTISVLAGLLWLRRDTTGTRPLMTSDLIARLENARLTRRPTSRAHTQRIRSPTERASCSSAPCSGSCRPGSTLSLPVRTRPQSLESLIDPCLTTLTRHRLRSPA